MTFIDDHVLLAKVDILIIQGQKYSICSFLFF